MLIAKLPLKTAALSVAFFSTILAPVPNIGISVANACGSQIVCGNSHTDKRFHGNVKLPNPINVTICYPDWNKLEVGLLNGRPTKYWGPTIRYGNWHADLKAVTHGACKTFSVRPGTIFESDNCTGTRVLRHKAVSPGTFNLK